MEKSRKWGRWIVGILCLVIMAMLVFSWSAPKKNSPLQDVQETPEVSEAIPEAAAGSAAEPEGDKELSAAAENMSDSEKTENSINPENSEGIEKQETAKPRLTIIGDSISTYTGFIPDDYSRFYPDYGDLTDVEDTWWMQVITNTGMEFCANASYSGGTVSGDSREKVDGRAACSDRRISDISGASEESPDRILIFTGANELLNNIPIGEYDGKAAVEEGVITQFGEAYALMLDKTAKAYPEAQIYCATLLEVSRENEAGEKFAFTNGLGLTASDYNQMIRKIAQERGLPLIDIYSCGITYENAKEYTIDGTHPNKAGAKLIADKVIEFFVSENR